MKTKEALIAHLEEKGIRQPGDPSGDVYRDAWLWLMVRGRSIPVFPLWGRLRRSFLLHDVHHLVTGYATDMRGELEIAAWEIGSGGCAWHIAMWFDRLGALLCGIVAAPAATSRAFRRGMHHRNLYRLRADVVLSMQFEDVLSFVGVPHRSTTVPG